MSVFQYAVFGLSTRAGQMPLGPIQSQVALVEYASTFQVGSTTTSSQFQDQLLVLASIQLDQSIVTYLLGFRIEPVGNVTSCNFKDWHTQLTVAFGLLSQQLTHVVNSIEE